MGLHTLAEKVAGIEVLDRVAAPAATAVKRVVQHGALKDLLSGTWLGHPLHPLLTDVPIGAFTSATVLDLVGGRSAQRAARTLVGLGLVSALPTAASGAADWSDTDGDDQRTGVVHALSNVVGLGFYVMSLRARRRGERGKGTVLGLAGMASMSIGGYLGGYLAYSRGIGVNNAFFQHHTDEWTPVLAATALPERKPVRVDVDGATVLVYRSNGTTVAIGSRCSHAGGPLDEGTADDGACTIECPWHQSVFRMTDGSVVHGPATVPQAAYDVRVNEGRIEVRHRR